MNISIRKSTDKEIKQVLKVNRLAFNNEKEPELVYNLLHDKTAMPFVSLVAFCDEEMVGHILFTKCTFHGNPESLSIYILAPLAIIPSSQKKGIGGMLIKEGHRVLKEMEVYVAVVIGHMDYYPRYGYIPDAKALGIETPYPIPEEVKDAWMVHELKPMSLKSVKGRVVCANALNKEEYWRE